MPSGQRAKARSRGLLHGVGFAGPRAGSHTCPSAGDGAATGGVALWLGPGHTCPSGQTVPLSVATSSSSVAVRRNCGRGSRRSWGDEHCQVWIIWLLVTALPAACWLNEFLLLLWRWLF